MLGLESEVFLYIVMRVLPFLADRALPRPIRTDSGGKLFPRKILMTTLVFVGYRAARPSRKAFNSRWILPLPAFGSAHEMLFPGNGAPRVQCSVSRTSGMLESQAAVTQGSDFCVPT